MPFSIHECIKCVACWLSKIDKQKRFSKYEEFESPYEMFKTIHLQRYIV